MADAGHQRFTKSVFYTPPPTVKSSDNFYYQLFWCWLVSIDVEMLVIAKKKKRKNLFDYVDYQNAGPKMNFWSVSRTLVIDVLWRQSMLQINGFGRKCNAYS